MVKLMVFRLITVPSSYLPANVEFFITHPMATVAPIKLTDYVTHENPPGINGTLVEGRIRYDAFVFENKRTPFTCTRKRKG
ncbi:hypothetical protein JS80_15715 [Anoxybacillus sp. KU2-6(11)]|nr:hypothetical protein JS80_15715 [Anoxybacillus sp. KU2-6(11)]